jgi:hypothetical protein
MSTPLATCAAASLVSPLPDPWLLRGRLVCERCGRTRLPVFDPGLGRRSYDCATPCQAPPLPAARVERDLLLLALMWTTGRSEHTDGPVVSADRLGACLAWPDRARAVIGAAYVAVTVTEHGHLRPIYRPLDARTGTETAR